MAEHDRKLAEILNKQQQQQQQQQQQPSQPLHPQQQLEAEGNVAETDEDAAAVSQKRKASERSKIVGERKKRRKE